MAALTMAAEFIGFDEPRQRVVTEWENEHG
jgi:hypothetical protein